MTRSTSAAGRGISAAALVAVLSLPACITGGGRPRQLYPGDPRPSGEVARLFGPIGTVDGEDVSRRGKSFALLPGCHVVRPVSKLAEVSATGPDAYVASVAPDLAFAIKMQAGHTYEIQVRPGENPAHTSVVAAVQAWDRDAEGQATPVAPIASIAEIDACQAWRPAS